MVEVMIRLGTLDREDALFFKHLLDKAQVSGHDPDTVDDCKLRLRGRGKRAKVAEKKGYNADCTLRKEDAERFALYLTATKVNDYEVRAISDLQYTIKQQAEMIRVKENEIYDLNSKLKEIGSTIDRWLNTVYTLRLMGW